MNPLWLLLIIPVAVIFGIAIASGFFYILLLVISKGGIIAMSEDTENCDSKNCKCEKSPWINPWEKNSEN